MAVSHVLCAACDFLSGIFVGEYVRVLVWLYLATVLYSFADVDNFVAVLGRPTREMSARLLNPGLIYSPSQLPCAPPCPPPPPTLISSSQRLPLLLCPDPSPF